MAKQEIDIGVEGNDGTGDSIRESFRKVNENFTEVYAVFGEGGQISFSTLSDTPDNLIPNTIPLVNDGATGFDLTTLASDSAIDDDFVDSVLISYTPSRDKIILRTTFKQLSQDLTPTLGGPLDARGNEPDNITGIALGPSGVTQDAVNAFNLAHDTTITVDDLVINKGYADARYIAGELPIRVEDEPADASEYTLTISSYSAGNIVIDSHGFDRTINGVPYTFNAEDTVPTALTNNTVYYLRYANPNQLSLHATKEQAKVQSQADAEANKIYVTGAIALDDIHTLVDTGYDASLQGFFLSNEAMPRKSIVRRQGDEMTGPLILHDSPGELSGLTSSKGELQAATKYYVDNTSYSAKDNLFVSTQGDDAMAGVPAGKEGTSNNYAYRTINKAAERAEEMIRASEAEPGPYFQTITVDDGASNAFVTQGDLNSALPQFTLAKDKIDANREFVIREITAYLKFTYPDFDYNIQLCERDLGLIMDSIAFDIAKSFSDSLTNANSLTRKAAERYYASSSGRIAITRQAVETIDSIETAKDIIAAVLLDRPLNQVPISDITQDNIAKVTTSSGHGLIDKNIVKITTVAGMTDVNDNFYYVKVVDATSFELFTNEELTLPVDSSAFGVYASGGIIGQVYQTDEKQVFDGSQATAPARNGVADKFDLVVEIIQDGLDAGQVTNFGKTYYIYVDPGAGNSTDQAKLGNKDVIPGKVIVGKISGAQGRIVNYYTKTDNANPDVSGNNDVIEVHLLKPKDFIANEDVEYGNFVNKKQITIFVESGQYEEDYPIKVSANVSIKGDEFRRVIVKPKNRISQSKWANTYMYRDRYFDGITVAEKGARFYNQTGEFQGHFGRHYLSDPEKEQNIGLPVTNAGGYNSAAAILLENKKFIQEEIVNFVNNNIDDILYDKTQFQADLENILTGITYDIVLGTTYHSTLQGLKFQRNKSIYKDTKLKNIWAAALTEAKSIVATYANVGTLANASFDEIVNIINNGSMDTDIGVTYPLTFTDFATSSSNAVNAKTKLQENKDFIAAEALAYLKSVTPKKYLDEAIRLRDYKNIVDMLTHDILYGGNYATIEFCKDLFIDDVIRLEITTRPETLQTLTHLKDVVEDVILGQAVTPTVGNAESQITSGAVASATEVGLLNSYIQKVFDMVNNDNLLALGNQNYPTLAGGDAGKLNAKSSIDGNVGALLPQIITFNDNGVDTVLTFDSAKCARDVGLIVEALVDDLKIGGDEFSREAQGQYFESYVQQYNSGGFSGQENATKAAITQIGVIADRLFDGSYATNLLEQNVNDVDYIAPDFKYGTGENGTDLVVQNLLAKINFAFNRLYNPPRRNDEMDVFLMNDATILRNLTVQGHGGFLLVLDPDGQILTKSPYIQTGSSFSKSKNAKIFGGGMFVDAYTGNVPVYVPETINPDGLGDVSGKVNNYEIWVRSEEGQGLFIRQPQLPCPFYIEGRRFQVNAISDYSQSNGWCKLTLDATSNEGDGFDETQFEENRGNIGRVIYLQTAGNRSMLGNDFTQINDLGYGLVTNNGAFSEMVSMFTYYCQAAYYAKNGSEIRSLNGSNGYGNFGLVSEGADPNEIPDQVTYATDMTMPGKSYVFQQSGSPTNEITETGIYLTDLKFPPGPNSIVQIDHGTQTIDGNPVDVGVKRYRISAVSRVLGQTATGGIYNDDVYRLQIEGKPAGENGDFFSALQGTVANGDFVEIRYSETHTFDKVRNKSGVVERPSTAINFDESDEITYRSVSFSGVNNFGDNLGDAEVQTTFNIPYDHIELPVDYANVGSGNGNGAGNTNIAIRTDDDTGNALDEFEIARLTRDIYGNQPPVSTLYPNAHDLIARNLRFVQEEVVAWINANNIVPGGYNQRKCYRDTGLIVRGVAMDLLYGGNAGTVQNANKYYVGTVLQLPADQDSETVQAIDKAKEIIKDYVLTKTSWTAINSNGYTQDTGGSNAEAGSATASGTLFDIVTDAIGDITTIPLTSTITGYAGGMIFAYGGRTHQIVGITDNGGGSSTVVIDPMPVTDLTTGSTEGISTAFTEDRVLYAGLPVDSTGEITIKISLCRATGHDFTQIGTGSFNDSNYPNVILGDPVGGLNFAPYYSDSPTATSAQVWERRKGRVFWMSTDQYGFFRVGQFFAVDQAQGSISFSGEIGITGATELGFKKGVSVDEFSIDDTMVDESDTAVPVESAVVGYIDKRLGRDKNDAAIPNGDRIGPKYVTATGSVEMEADLQMGTNKIENVGTPTSGSDVATKAYVDAGVLGQDNWDVLRESSKNDIAVGDLLAYTGNRKVLITVPDDASGSDTFEVGDTIENASSNKTAVIKDIVQTTDTVVGENEPGNNIWILTYELTAGADFVAEQIEGTGGKADVSATILRGPFDEIGNASNSSNSDVSFTLTRQPDILNGSLAGSIGEYDIQLRAGVVENADVSGTASIVQSKLLLERAGVLDSSASLLGASGDAVGQTNRGLAAFDANHFTEEVELTVSANITANAGDYIYQGALYGEVVANVSNSVLVKIRTNDQFISSSTVLQKAIFTNGQQAAPTSLGVQCTSVKVSGFIGLLPRSIQLTDLAPITTDTVIGRSTTGTGDTELVPFADIAKQGFAIEDKDFDQSVISKISGQRLNFGSEVTVVNGETITQGNIEGQVQGSVFGETSFYVVDAINTQTSNPANFSNGAVTGSVSGSIGNVTAVNTSVNLLGEAMVKLDDGVYGSVPISTGNSSDSIARRTASGGLQVESLILGGSSTNTVLSESGGTLTFSTLTGGKILEASGATAPTVTTGGRLQIGDTAITAANSTFYDNTIYGAGGASEEQSALATRWIYTSFIEAGGEKGAGSTGISIGAGTGFDSSAADVISLITGGAEQLIVSSSTMTVNNNMTVSGELNVSGGSLIETIAGDIRVRNAVDNANLFNVSGSNGNTTVAGTLGVTSSISTNTSLSVGTSATFGGGYGSTGVTISSAGAISANSNIITGGNLTVDGNTTLKGNMDFGNASTDTLTFNCRVDSAIIPTGTRNLGSSTNAWSTVYGGTFSGTATTAKYADLAENYLGDADYEPGTVVVLGGDAEVTTTNKKGDTRVAGVVTTNPAHLMNSALEGDYVTGIALAGRVPCKVIGVVAKGDILVSSAIPGYAMVDNNPSYGTIIGKAVASKEDNERGFVEVLVGKS
jgi:hypothetical protein